MSDKKFKESMENKTAAGDTKEPCGQYDAWEMLPDTDKEGVKMFHHQDGKDFFCIQYKPDDKEYVVDRKIAKILSGKTIEEQMEFYRITESTEFSSTAYGDVTKEELRERSVRLYDYKKLQKLLFKGNILIGAIIDCWWSFMGIQGILLLDKYVCTYSASDNEGSGTNDRTDCAYLIFTDSPL